MISFVAQETLLTVKKLYTPEVPLANFFVSKDLVGDLADTKAMYSIYAQQNMS